MNAGIIIGLALPLAGTTLGAASVFVLRRELGRELQKAMLGFASGVMLAASVWSLLIPAIDMAGAAGGPEWLPAVGGFLAGMGFLLALDMLIPHLHMGSSQPEGARTHLGRASMLALAVALHNLPEGMAVGVALAGMGDASTASALTLAAGIAIQNLPEGAIISVPLRDAAMSRGRAFGYGFLSGVVEPVGAVATLMLTHAVAQALPFILAFAAGAMVYVVVEELIPQAQSEPHTNTGTVGVALGFALMMLLDVALG